MDRQPHANLGRHEIEKLMRDPAHRHYSFEEYINDERQHLLMVWQSC